MLRVFESSPSNAGPNRCLPPRVQQRIRYRGEVNEASIARCPRFVGIQAPMASGLRGSSSAEFADRRQSLLRKLPYASSKEKIPPRASLAVTTGVRQLLAKRKNAQRFPRWRQRAG